MKIRSLCLKKKQEVFQVAAVVVLLHVFTTLTLTKHMKKELNKN